MANTYMLLFDIFKLVLPKSEDAGGAALDCTTLHTHTHAAAIGTNHCCVTTLLHLKGLFYVVYICSVMYMCNGVNVCVYAW